MFETKETLFNYTFDMRINTVNQEDAFVIRDKFLQLFKIPFVGDSRISSEFLLMLKGDTILSEQYSHIKIYLKKKDIDKLIDLIDDYNNLQQNKKLFEIKDIKNHKTSTFFKLFFSPLIITARTSTSTFKDIKSAFDLMSSDYSKINSRKKNRNSINNLKFKIRNITNFKVIMVSIYLSALTYFFFTKVNKISSTPILILILMVLCSIAVILLKKFSINRKNDG